MIQMKSLKQCFFLDLNPTQLVHTFGIGDCRFKLSISCLQCAIIIIHYAPVMSTLCHPFLQIANTRQELLALLQPRGTAAQFEHLDAPPQILHIIIGNPVPQTCHFDLQVAKPRFKSSSLPAQKLDCVPLPQLNGIHLAFERQFDCVQRSCVISTQVSEN